MTLLASILTKKRLPGAKTLQPSGTAPAEQKAGKEAKASHHIEALRFWSVNSRRDAAIMVAGDVLEASTGCSPTG